MSYQVIARRWRPQNFDEVVYQEHISKTLRNSIELKRISHAYIFAGPRGVGKTTSARIFAKSLNCVNGPTADPCGVCENCVEIKEGRSFDVIEIDGASNNSVDDVRDLREKVMFAPVKGHYKVYIIDEVHMLSGAAFNALLKTLEEPPSHVVFIFATTEIHKLPDTILSRCQKFFFKKITPDAIAAHLKTITSKEGFSIDEKALYAIARAGEGSMRDAQSLLEQVLSFSNGEVTEHDALAQLGIVPLSSFMRVMRGVSAGSAKDIVDELNAVAASGADMQRYAAYLADGIRALRLIRNGVDIRTAAGFSSEELAELTAISDLFHDEELSRFYERCASLQSEIRFIQNDLACVEMACLDFMATKKSPSLAALLAKLGEVKAASPSIPQSSTKESAPQSGIPQGNMLPQEIKAKESLQTENAVSDGRKTVSETEESNDTAPVPDDADLSLKTDLSEYDTDHPMVEKIKEIFHGEEVKRGE